MAPLELHVDLRPGAGDLVPERDEAVVEPDGHADQDRDDDEGEDAAHRPSLAASGSWPTAPVWWRIRFDDASVGDHGGERGPLDLAARGLRDRLGLDEQDACGPEPAPPVHGLRDVVGDTRELFGREPVPAHLGDHVEALGAGALALDSDGGRVPDAGDVVGGLLDVRGGDVQPAHDDHVLDAPRDEEVALGIQESEIPRVKPPVAEDVGRGLGIAVVAPHDAGTLDEDLAHLAWTGTAGAVGSGDLHPYAPARRAHGDEASRRVGAHRSTVRPDRHRERRLGQPVGRREDVADAEALLERADRGQPHRLRAGQRHPEAREVEACGVVNVPDTVPVAEVRGHGDLGSMLGDRLEPRAGISEVWREERESRARVERPEGQADQSHVVVEREPADERVGRRDPHRLDHHLHRPHHVPVAEHDAAGHRRAARRVLEEADVVLGRGDRGGDGGRGLERHPASGDAGRPAPRLARSRRRRGTSRS